MKPVFADTSYYLAMLSPEDRYHGAAVGWSQYLLGRVVVTEYVLVELGNAVCRSKFRDRYVPLVRNLFVDPGTTVVASSPTLFKDGLRLYEARPDQTWSLVDCLSFLVMKQRRIKEALTTDKHFVPAGFRALLREGATY